MPKKRRKPDNAKLTYRTLTGGFHAMYEPKVSSRIHAAALKQIAIRNLTTEYLIEHGPTPLRVSPATPEAPHRADDERRRPPRPRQHRDQ